jgi:hypothetical protein
MPRQVSARRRSYRLCRWLLGQPHAGHTASARRAAATTKAPRPAGR